MRPPHTHHLGTVLGVWSAAGGAPEPRILALLLPHSGREGREWSSKFFEIEPTAALYRGAELARRGVLTLTYSVARGAGWSTLADSASGIGRGGLPARSWGTTIVRLGVRWC